MSRGAKAAAAAGFVFLVWAALGLTVVRPSEQGVVFRLGVLLGAPLPPGIHFSPWGIDRVVRVEVTRTFTVPVGFRTLPDGRAASSAPDESYFLTGDTNILALQLAVQYRIARPAEALATVREAPELVRCAAESVVTASVGHRSVDDLLTTGRVTLLDDVRRKTQELLDRWVTGLEVVSVALRAVDPPPPVVAAFQDVQNARSDRERFVNEAQSYASDTLPKARGEALALVSAAGSAKTRRVETALGETARFESVRREASAAPAAFRHRLYLEALEKAFPRMAVYVLDDATSLRLVRPAGGAPDAATR